jgi:hypothetical protein
MTSANKWLLIAVVLSPWAVVPAWITSGIFEYFTGITRPANWTDLFPIIVPYFGIPIAYLFTLVIGLPAFLLLRQFQSDSLLAVLCVGWTSVWIVFLAMSGGDMKYEPDFVLYLYNATWVAMTAWLLAVRAPKLRSNHRIDTDRVAAGHAER